LTDQHIVGLTFHSTLLVSQWANVTCKVRHFCKTTYFYTVQFCRLLLTMEVVERIKNTSKW